MALRLSMPLFVLPLTLEVTHIGSHSSHGLTSLVATSMRAIACHKRRQECHLSVDMSCKLMVCYTRVHAATMTR